MKLTLNPDGSVNGEGLTPMEKLIATHRFQIGVHLLAAKAICDAGETDIRKLELKNHFREINRRYGILSGLTFALGVHLSEAKMSATQRKLEITDEELTELAQNATDIKPSFGGDHLN